MRSLESTANGVARSLRPQRLKKTHIGCIMAYDFTGGTAVGASAELRGSRSESIRPSVSVSMASLTREAVARALSQVMVGAVDCARMHAIRGVHQMHYRDTSAKI